MGFRCVLVSTVSLHDGPAKRQTAREIVVSETFSPGMRAAAGGGGGSMAAHLRQSVPNMKFPPQGAEPPKIYALHLLLTSNYRLPGDADRANLEVT